MPDSSTTFAPDHADEDRWVVPDAWWGQAVPSRGLGPVRAVEPHPTAVFDLGVVVAGQRDSIREILALTAGAGNADLVAAAQEALADPGTCSPLGAAVIAAALEPFNTASYGVIDAWVLGRGLVFAAEAAALWAELYCDYDWNTTTRGWEHTVRRWSATEAGRGDAAHSLVTMRTHLAAAGEADYRAVVARLGELRGEHGGLAVRVATSFLAPTETDWTTADLSEFTPGTVVHNSRFLLLTACVNDRAQLETLFDAFHPHQLLYGSARQSLYAALVRRGPESVDALERMLRHPDLGADTVRELAEMLACFPTDAAFTALVSRAEQRYVPLVLLAVARRFPRRALRLLGPAATKSGMARHILRAVAYANPALVAELPEIAVYLDAERPRAAVEELPEVLRTTPWLHARSKTKQITLTDLAPPAPDALAWAPGEREEWEKANVSVPDHYRKSLASKLALLFSGDGHASYYQSELLALAPEELVRPQLATMVPGRLWASENAVRRILARFGTDGITYVLRAAQTNSTDLADLLGPVTGTQVTALMTRWLDGKRTRSAARNWFDRNRTAALPVLIVAALAKPSKDRRAAESALRWLSESGHRAEIDTAAAVFGDRAATAITTLLNADPLEQLPAKLPGIPTWLAPELLPALALRGNKTVLPESSARDVCIMLAMCGPNGDYAGVAQLTAAADPESLAEFAWGLFEVWKFADYPAKDGWVLHALGLLGNDETARRLGPLIRLWPGESAHARAVAGLDVLTALGTDVALMQLNGIAEKAKFKGLKTKAQEKVAEVAESLDLTPEQLADRLVPDFGLDANGVFALDYGSRGFIVGFDEQLKPTVSDAIRNEHGEWEATALRKSLPKPGAKDDPELAPAAYKAFAALKKDVRSAAADQIRRFERAMVKGRRWPAEEHRRLFVEHPLLWHLSRRLVWVTLNEQGTVTGSFRIAEDRSYADAGDDPHDIEDTTIVGLAHPLHLGAALTEWAEVFADYEILQPFPQLQREIYAFTEEERTDTFLRRFQDLKVPTGTVLGLGRFGWERGDPMDGGVSIEMFRELGNGHSAVIDMEPGIIAGDAMEFNTQKIAVRISKTGDESYYQRNQPRPAFAELDAITASELLRELETLEATERG